MGKREAGLVGTRHRALNAAGHVLVLFILHLSFFITAGHGVRAHLVLLPLGSLAAAVLTGPAQSHARVDEDTARTLCAGCHRLPPPDVLPRAAWKDEIERMARIRENREVPPGEVG